MKTIFLLFLTIGCAALMPGGAYGHSSTQASRQSSSESYVKTAINRPQDAEQAAPADGDRHQKDRNAPDEQRDRRHASGKNHPRSPAAAIKDRPKQVPNNRERSTSGNAMGLHQPGSAKSGGAARGGSIQRGTVNRALRVRPNVVGPTAPVRHRGANPAAIGGSANSDGRNTGAINGTRMNRRP